MAPSLEAYAKNSANKTALLKIDVDKHSELSDKMGVRSIPAFFIYDAKGKLIKQGPDARSWVNEKI